MVERARYCEYGNFEDQAKAKAMAKSRLENSLSVTTVGRHRVTQTKSVVHFSLSISAENVAKKGI